MTPDHGTVQTERVAPPSPLLCARTLFCDESNANADHSDHTGTECNTHFVSTSTADTVSMQPCSSEDSPAFEQSSVCSMEANSSPASDLDSDMDAYLSSTAGDRASMSSDTSTPGGDSDRGSDCYTPVCYRLMCTDDDAPSKHEEAWPSAPSHHSYNHDRFYDALQTTQGPGR